MEKISLRTSTLIAERWTAERDATSSDWTRGLPVLAAGDVTLRELRMSDAPSLFAMLTTEEVATFVSPLPTTVPGLERFIAMAHGERRAGRSACFGVVPRGMDTAIGLFQVRQLDPGFASAEWGFAIGSPFWGSGLFTSSARLILEFAFMTLGVHRLEARAAVGNGRGNAGLRKVGAVCEGVLRRSFLRNGEYLDEHLWSILDLDWHGQRSRMSVTIN